jgi:hypothetical protein
MPRLRTLATILALPAALAIAGCGGGSSSADLAGFAAPGSLVFVEGKVRPTGTLQKNVDSVSQKVGGISNLGEYVVSKLESSAREDGEPFDYAKEVEPWLGEKAAVAFKGLREGDLTGFAIVLQTTDSAAAREFLDRQVRQSKHPYEKSSYEGVEFEVGGSEGNAIGVVGDNLVDAEGEAGFKRAVDASNGESLGDESRFQDAISAASDGSLADVYVDVGGLIDASGDSIDPTAREVLQGAGIDPSEATAVASVVPGSDRVEIDLSSDLGGEKAPSGDASQLLASMPASSFAAFAVSGFGDQLTEALDNLDASGIPGQVQPHQLKSGLAQVGIVLDKIASSLEDAAVFAEGAGKRNLGGALVMTTNSKETVRSIAQLGKIVRGLGAPGVTAVTGAASGFSIRSAELGHYPLVVVGEGNRVAVGYGLRQTLKALETSTETLGDSASYKAAVAALGDTPITAFVDGPAALRLAESLVPRSESGFWEAVPYLKKIGYIAVGSGSEGELATAKAIAGLTR